MNNNLRQTAPKKPGSKKGVIKRVSEFEVYASFIALPDVLKVEVFGFDTDLGFAKKYKISNATLSDWKQDERLWAMRSKFMAHFKKLTPNVLHALYKQIEKEGKAAEVLAWVKIIEEFNDKGQGAPVVPIQININDIRSKYE
jgi:hypothetical protein